ncbi:MULTISPECIES: M949_RS01915 family surface polysaccharide biosynthesis protein [Flavobacterium]|uniref:M949_RS01915 family surface polysaccharide biosynthesis protein n=1 Tax=Flavobacterium jumunjinense TaxID=998845 RepID=A0ABV5GJK6_9FLAO|nr:MULTISPECIES: hypothetical protein [Flavobacterium]
MNKNNFLYIIFLYSIVTFGQTEIHKEKFRTLEPDIWLGIWDKENSNHSIVVDTLSYDDIPKVIDFRGTVVEALKWKDKQGENILIQTVTGHFNWKDYEENSTNYMIQDKSELYAYLFQKGENENEYQRKWKIYDFTECFGVDWFTGFIPKATTITDLNKDGIAEITIPYVLICRGGMDPGTMKIIMYEASTKYALRGETKLMCDSKNPYGGEYTESDNLKDNTIFKNFLLRHWNRNTCEAGKYY